MPRLLDIMGRVAVPPVLPFTEDGEISFGSFEQLIDFIISNKFCDSLILTGTTGEFHTLSDEERVEVWKAGKQAAAGRVPLVAGVGTASSRSTIQLAETAETMCFDAIMVVLPYYSRPTQTGIEQHFRDVAKAVALPVMVYNIPLFTGVNMDPETLERLMDVPNILGIKEEAGIQPTQATQYALRTPAEFSIYCGDDTMVLQVLPQRGVGVVSGGSAIFGDHMHAMIAAWLGGDNRTASEIYFRLAPFFAALNQNGRINPIPILRAAIELASGIKIGPPRRPQAPATAEEVAVIRPLVEALRQPSLVSG
jgi:4-hydroxy-tetrahydrodipicolinate synthase